MFAERLARRRVLAGLACVPWALRADASPRPLRGGKLGLRVPFVVKGFDPHQLDDVGCMLFGEALFGSLYRVVGDDLEPWLAERLPQPHASGLRVPLRKGLRSARGRPLGAADIKASLERARRGAGRHVLASYPRMVVNGDDLLVPQAKDPHALALALASPLTAVVPRVFSPQAPDGTGPFVADANAGQWTLRRNPLASEGPALLESLRVRSAATLADSLRAFETGEDDVAWHGLGLHETRPGAKAFDAGAVGAVVLATGNEARGFGSVGAAQSLCDGIAPHKLAQFNLGAAWSGGSAAGWTGPSTELLVADDSVYLRELADVVALNLSRPGHTVSLRVVSATELRERLRTRAFTLAVHCVRPFWPTPVGVYAAMLASADAEHASSRLARLPKVSQARVFARGLTAGLLGELRWQGGSMGEVPRARAGGIEWGDLTVARKKA